MPAPDAVLAALTEIANTWRWLATTWHIVLPAGLVLLTVGWRPSVRFAGLAMVLPVASVGTLAWLSGNPFNGAVFCGLALALAVMAIRSPTAAVQAAPLPWKIAGLGAVAFGWVYPHFLAAESWTAYLYASPFGLVPCPTLTLLIGITLCSRGFLSRPFAAVLVAAGMLYGAIGVFRLGVALDWGLLIAAALLAGGLAVGVGQQRPLETGALRRSYVQRHV